MAQDIADGESVEVPGSGSNVYTLKNTGGVYSCTCPAWRHQGTPIERRSCKHLKRYRGDDAEKERCGAEHFTPSKPKSDKEESAPKLLLAHKWDNAMDLTGWWMSEKLDGVRAYWNGSTFLSRLGNEFMAPKWFTKDLGDEPLDGELWLDRGEFQRCVSIVRRQDRSDHWKKLQFLVFDAPGHDAHFEDRVAWLKEKVADHPYANAVEHVKCESTKHLEDELARVEGLGGEGLMMRQPQSKYVHGRSTTLLKVKTFHDAEGVVVGYVAGKGKHKGRTGALVCELEDGTRFHVGTGMSDKERENPPDVGTVITFRCQELTKAGVPRFPSYVGERVDVKLKAPSLTGGKAKKGPPKGTQPKSGKAKTTQSPRAKKGPELRRGDARFRIRRRGDELRIRVSLESAEDANAELERIVAQALASGWSKDDDDVPKKKKNGEAKKSSEGARYFEMVSGKSEKFWEITMSGNEHTVRYGRIGANGAVRTKTFVSEAAMTESAEKLIASKVGKGYVEKA